MKIVINSFEKIYNNKNGRIFLMNFLCFPFDSQDQCAIIYKISMLIQTGFTEDELLQIVYHLIINFHHMNLIVLINVIFNQILMFFSHELGYSILTNLIYVSRDPSTQRLIVKHLIQSLNSLILTKLGSSIIVTALQYFNPLIAGEIFQGLANINNLCSGKYSHVVILVLIDNFFNYAKILFEDLFDDNNSLTQFMKSHFSLKIIIKYWTRMTPIEKFHLFNKLDHIYESNLKNTHKKAWKKTINRMKEEVKNINTKFTYFKDKEIDHFHNIRNSFHFDNENNKLVFHQFNNPNTKGVPNMTETSRLLSINHDHNNHTSNQVKKLSKKKKNFENMNNCTTLLINYKSGHMDFDHKIHPETPDKHALNSRSIIKE